MTLRPKRWTTIALVTVVLACVPFVSTQANHPEFYSYDDLTQIVQEWEQLGAKIEVPVTTEGGRDVYLVKVGNGPFTIMFSSVLHANEPSGSEAFIRFVWALLGRQDPSFEKPTLPGVHPNAPVFKALRNPEVRAELLSRVTIVGFPMMDPDGFANDHTRDFMANTDYQTKLTEQSAALDYALDRYEPDLYLDSHGGPDSPDLNIGLVEPLGTPQAVIGESRRAAAIAWKAAAAHDISLAYFEEHFLEIVLGQHDEPFASADEIYWNSISKLLPLTQESYQLEGLPAVYTETVGLQSADPSISISEGASAQEVTMAGLAFEYSGLLSGERPEKLVAGPADGPLQVKVTEPAHRFFAAVRWKSALQDYDLQLLDEGGEVVAESAAQASDPYGHASRSRALFVENLPAGAYELVAIPRIEGLDDGAVVRANWRVDDRGSRSLRGILDEDADVRLCLEGQTAYGSVVASTPQTERLGSPKC
jgi:hypothetical protein